MFSHRQGLLVFIIAIRFVEPVWAQDKAADWPVFRGNTTQTGIAAGLLPEGLAVNWSFRSDDGFQGSPVIAGQTVYIGNVEGRLYALDLASGNKKWEYKAGGIISASPAYRAGAVYVGDSAGTFHCIDAATGKRRWTIANLKQIASAANFAPGKILFGSYDHHLYCVTEDGKIAWQFKTKEKMYGTPAIVGDRVLVGGCDKNLYVIDLNTGQQVSTIDMGGHVAASAALSGDHLFLGNMDGDFLAVDWKKGSTLWRFEGKRGAGFHSSAAVTDDLVLAGCRDKVFRAFDRRTGKEVWSFATRGKVDGSPVVVGQRVVVGSLDGHLYILDLARGTELARFKLGLINGSPAVFSQGIVVATFNGDVFCLTAKK